MVLTIVWLVVGVAASGVTGLNVTLLEVDDLTARLENNPFGGLNLVMRRKEISEVAAVIGRRTGKVLDVVQDGDVVIQFTADTTLRVTVERPAAPYQGHVLTFTWEAPKSQRLEDCVNLGQYGLGQSHWYGGPEQKRQYWPIEKLTLIDYSYVTKEADNCAIAEPYWLNSEGLFYYFDKKVPLFVDQNDLEKNAACFIAQIKPPYSTKRDKNDLVYAVGIFDDPRTAHLYAVNKYIGKPSGVPDERMIKYPIWSTWARYKRDIDQDVVMDFANEIIENGFPHSQLEIDDLWEECYGSMKFDLQKFPNMKGAVQQLKAKGFRVTLWTHPFLNKGCEPLYSEAVNKGYLVMSEYGGVETSWWNDNDTTTAYVDFTNPAAREWYTERLLKLKNQYGIDGFRFDAGESDWPPQIPVLRGDIRNQPGVATADYAREAATLGSAATLRTGYRTQDLPVFVRMGDKDSYWTFENGLPTVITTLLQMNIDGYPLVLPDIIGGNGYDEPPSKELFIRWMQANTFMPAMQFSHVPWDYDKETVRLAKKFVDLHAKYAGDIATAIERAARDGSPVNPPIWWIAPNDTTALDIADQYLLGEDILVAPVIERQARTRDIYLPEGTWLAQGDSGQRVEGGDWLRDYPAPLGTLPFFVRA